MSDHAARQKLRQRYDITVDQAPVEGTMEHHPDPVFSVIGRGHFPPQNHPSYITQNTEDPSVSLHTAQASNYRGPHLVR